VKVLIVHAQVGFEPAAHCGLSAVDDIEAEYVLERTVRPGALAGQSGALALPQEVGPPPAKFRPSLRMQVFLRRQE